MGMRERPPARPVDPVSAYAAQFPPLEAAREDGLLGTMLPSDEQLAEQFGTFSPWARQAAWLVNEFAWERLNGEVDAQAPTTRGEAAATLYNLFYISGVLNV